MTGPISGRPGQGQGEEIGPVETPQDFPSRPRCDTGDEEGSRRPVDRAVAATGDLMQRPKRKTAIRKPRVGFSDPERQRGRHASAALFDLANLGAQDFDVRWGPPGPDGTLGLELRACSLLKRFPKSSPSTLPPVTSLGR